MRSIDDLIADIRREAASAEFPVDLSIYEKAEKDPLAPVLFAGSLTAPVCVFGRDLGRDEVALGQPLVGAGGKLVRRGLIRAFGKTASTRDDMFLESALEFALLTNTVPYKPPGNKAYPGRVKERFRPFVAELIASFWTGDRVICLGTEAFQWFAPYAESGAAEAFWARDDRYEADLPCTLTAEHGGGTIRKRILLAPLPHPSPLNQRWYKRFPEMLDSRLRAAVTGA